MSSEPESESHHAPRAMNVPFFRPEGGTNKPAQGNALGIDSALFAKP